MLPNRIKLPHETSGKLRSLQGRTGLTPNLICRFALVLSLADESGFDPSAYPEEDREFNKHTLLGDAHRLYEALIVQRHGESTGELLVAHISRGVAALSGRIKSLADLLDLASSKELAA